MEQEADLTLSEAVAMLGRRRWVVLSVAAVVFLAAVCYVTFTPPVFRATTVLNIEPESRNSAVGPGVSEVQDADYFETQYKLITSETALRRVYSDLALASSPDFPAIGALRRAITVVPVLRTRLCRVNVDATDPRLAMKISSTLSQHFVEQNLNDKLFMSKDVLDALKAGMKGADSGKLSQSLPSVVNNKLIQDIKAQIFEGEAQLADLKMKYTENHPAMISKMSRLASMRTVLDRETENIVSSLKTELSGQLRAKNVRIIDLPQLPDEPIRPRKALAVIFGAIGGIALGILGALLLETFDYTVRSQDDIERRLGLPFLGLIPHARLKREETIYAPLLSTEVSLFSESFRTLRAMVGMADAVEAEPILLITSSVQEEGKSFVASNLAVALAQLGQRVLLVDGDLRRPRQHGHMRVSNERGLADYLSGASAQPESVVQESEVPNLDVVACGARPSNPAELLSKERLAEFMAWARGRYSRVIVDCPPVFPISDVLLWGRHVKSTIFVTRFGRTRVPLIRRACARLRGKDIKILGGVINGARLGTMTYADGRYYEQYCSDYVEPAKS
jgi:capsular exopolysaccharide synthesis family protein